MSQRSSRIHRGLWFLRLFLMCASLVGVLLIIDQLKHKRISLEAMTGAYAEEGITATVVREPAAPAASKQIDKSGEEH